ncbi:SDR family oxidoreductase [Actinokineospora globicatena]|uniref:SDR family oxidoreductase n=1 Tax=Actinokineospora globicatena TaxID=103729 RepID=UPI0020A30129|nr:SDR family oxidoreductase [Actinokineospora globicatena]MCP2304846.1 NAD(P)-dependent dehydrogenase, short-chain alcohol dehydrogenase family [Actinokineospora globicatena]GLW77775.1 3-oxoacyl-ACP reductase [Actinokineospora globicatena]GLW85557.1 3-oxoacyl-ACP reductase [Actinokineospora globicatena]
MGTAEYAGRAALVTGASRGIGLAIATELARRGAAVAISSRKQDDLDAAAASITAAAPGARVLAVAGNTGVDADRERVVARTVDELGGLDVLVNNTGINPVYGPLVDVDLDGVRKIFDTNVVAALGFVQLAYHSWMAAHGGVVINIASVAGLRSSGVIAAYGASKAALVRLTEELAWQLGPGIRVNAVAPAVVKTRFATALYADREEEASAPYPMKRLGTPEDVADLVAFLCSDQASWITGETVRVDGGLLATGTL